MVETRTTETDRPSSSASSIKRARYDKKGEPINTVIGAYSVATRKASIKLKDKMKSEGSSLDESPNKIDPIDEDVTSPFRKKRHHVTFADEVTGDKKKLTVIHPIESYKKYN